MIPESPVGVRARAGDQRWAAWRLRDVYAEGRHCERWYSSMVVSILVGALVLWPIYKLSLDYVDLMHDRE